MRLAAPTSSPAPRPSPVPPSARAPQSSTLGLGMGHMRVKFGATARFSYDGADVGENDSPLGLGMCDGDAQDAGDGNGAVWRSQIDVRV